MGSTYADWLARRTFDLSCDEVDVFRLFWMLRDLNCTVQSGGMRYLSLGVSVDLMVQVGHASYLSSTVYDLKWTAGRRFRDRQTYRSCC